MKHTIIKPSIHRKIKYGNFFLVVALQNKTGAVSHFNSYSEAVRENERISKVKDKSKAEIEFLILSEVQFGTNVPVLVGFDTNLNPFKDRYSEFKTVVRSRYKPRKVL